MEVNQKELAKILGVTDRRIRQLKEDYGLFANGVKEEKTRKRYILEKCIPEYINYKLEAEVVGGAFLNKEKEQAEHERIRKKISMLKLRKMRRELHEAKDVEEFLTDMLVEFREKLLSLPQKVAPLIVAEDDVNVIMNVLEKEMFESLDQLSEYDPAKIDKDTTSTFFDEEEEDDDDE